MEERKEEEEGARTFLKARRGRARMTSHLALPRWRPSWYSHYWRSGVSVGTPPADCQTKMAAPMLRRTALGALNAVIRWQRPCSGSAASVTSHYPGVVESHEEFHFVERLIPPTQVPKPLKHTGVAPSGWIPPKDTLPDLPYIVRRSRMHNIPVYKDITHGNRHMTIIRKIEGDIWALEAEVREFLTNLTGKTPATQVNEINNSIRIKGYYDTELQTWLAEKGF